MEQMTKQTETRTIKQESHTAQRNIVTIFVVIEVILAFRLIFKLLGANPENGFVHAIYAVTQFYVGIFEGIFSWVTFSGAETTAFFEPATIIGMLIVAQIAWVVLKLIAPRIGNREERIEYTEHNNQKNRNIQ